MCIRLSMMLAAVVFTAGCDGAADQSRSAENEAAAQAPPEATVGAGRTDAASASNASDVSGAQARTLLRRSGGDSPHLIDSTGMAVYVLRRTSEGVDCDAACQNIWPAVLSDVAHPLVAPDVDQAKVGTLPLPDGTLHVTYDGRPLYRYGGDRGASTVTGHDVQDHWGQWSLVLVERGESTEASTN